MNRSLVDFKQLMALVRLVRLTPFDTSTPAGRSNERHRRIALTALASAAAKAVRILTVLISVPLTLEYLGTERYGLWMTISSVFVILGFADLGIGNGLLNGISEANGKDDREMARRYVSSAFFMLFGVALILGASFAVAYPWVPWSRVFNVSSPQAVTEAGAATAVFVGCFLVNVPLGIVQKVQMGYQESFFNSLWRGLGNLLGLIGVLIIIYLKAGLPWLVLAMAGAPALASLLNGLMLFGFRRPWLQPKWGSATKEDASRIFQLGILFFVLQLAVTLAYSSDNIVAAQVLGLQAVAQYSVSTRMFSIAPIILEMVLAPLWPAYGESIARGDIAWIKGMLVRSLVMALLITGLPSALLVVFGVQVVDLWVGSAVTPSFLLLLGLAVWTVMAAEGNAVAMLLNGANELRFQAACAVFMSTGAVIAKVTLAHKIGLPGIVWGTILAYTLFTAIPMTLYLPRLLATMQKSKKYT